MAQPQLEYIPTGSQAFVYKVDRDLWPVYHFHPEFDILLSLKDQGKFISGDHLGLLEKGTIFMNGPNIPHAVMPTGEDDGDWDRPAMAVLQFSEDTLGRDFLGRNELAPVRRFLQRDAQRGLEFHGRTRELAGKQMLAMREMDDLQRLVAVLDLLRLLAQSDERYPLASPGYSPSLRKRDIRRIDEVIRYVQQHKAEPIALESVAELIGLTPKSFCRFFKANTGKTFVAYLNELRIGDACQRLIETATPITEIAFDCGFNNLSNFNRRFREIKGMAPRDFRAASAPAIGAGADIPLPAHRQY